MGWLKLKHKISIAVVLLLEQSLKGRAGGLGEPNLYTVKPKHLEEDYFLLPKENRDYGILIRGDFTRARKALDKLLRGAPLTITALGASITEGIGIVPGGHSWPGWLQQMMAQTFPGSNITVVNGAVGATMSDYMANCVLQHAPQSSDVVIVEYAVNDHWWAEPRMHNPMRTPFERLMRTLLNYPKRPVVIILNAFAWRMHGPKGIDLGSYWHDSHSDFLELASYYRLPVLSVKAAAYHLLLEGKMQGFRRDNLMDREGKAPAKPSDGRDLDEGAFWLPDGVHGGSKTGNKVMAELVYRYLMLASRSLVAKPYNDAREGAGLRGYPLPQPMFPDNWEPAGGTCLFRSKFKALVVKAEGWQWKDEGTKGRKREGMVAHNPGAKMEFDLDLSSINTRGYMRGQPFDIGFTLGVMFSYTGMGMAEVECTQGCNCGPQSFDSHWDSTSSQVRPIKFLAHIQIPTEQEAAAAAAAAVNSNSSSSSGVTLASAPEALLAGHKCRVGVTVLKLTKSGGNKIKIVGVMLMVKPDENPALTDVAADNLSLEVDPLLAAQADREAAMANAVAP